MNRTMKSNDRSPLPRLAVWALLGGILANSACTKDAAGPVQDGLNAARSSLLQSETLVPIMDVSNPGSFSTTTAHLWSSLDEVVPNDGTDYILKVQFGGPPTVSEATVMLSSPVGTPSPSQSFILWVRWRVLGNYSTFVPQPTKLSYYLLSGLTVVASGTVYPSGNNWVSGYVGVPNNLSSYSDLNVRFQMELKPATSYDRVEGQITWAQLQIR